MRTPRSVLGVVLFSSCLVFGQLPVRQPITVGKNVHVSSERGQVEHGEVVLAADPGDPQRLLGASMQVSGEKNRLTTVVYASSDGGSTWIPTLETDSFTLSGDPSVAFGPDGRVYYSIMASQSPHSVLDFLKIYTSGDHGRTWDVPATIPNTEFDYLDREFVAVDNTGGPYRGRVYVCALGTTRVLEGSETVGSLNLYRSLDGGRTFIGPVKRISSGERHVFVPGGAVVLSDGTLAVIFSEVKNVRKKGAALRVEPSKPDESNAWLKVMTSRDGGESLDDAVTVNDFYLDWKGGPKGANSAIPSLAVDPGSQHFKDRLYAVWPDERSGRLEILFSSSTDKGRTWSTAKVISESRAFDVDAPAKGPSAFSPVVAVNNQGVVGVMWYDRRDNPDNLGYFVRFTASLDGGDTFLPSVRVSASPHARQPRDQWALIEGLSSGTRQSILGFNLMLSMFYINGGHTAGMAADAAAVFHPFWVDNRTGVAQVWTAPVTVTGAALPHGSAELAALDEIAENVVLELRNIAYDRATNTASLDARLKNISKDPIGGPIKVRIVELRSDIGIAKVIGADNGEDGVGAVLDFTPVLHGGQLGPGETSGVKHLVFRLEDVRPVWQNGTLNTNVLRVGTRAFGRVVKPGPDKKER